MTISLELFSILMAEVELMSATPPGSRVLSCEGNDIFSPQAFTRPSAFLLLPLAFPKILLISDFCVKRHVTMTVLLFSMHKNSVEVTETLPSNERST